MASKKSRNRRQIHLNYIFKNKIEIDDFYNLNVDEFNQKYNKNISELTFKGYKRLTEQIYNNQEQVKLDYIKKRDIENKTKIKSFYNRFSRFYKKAKQKITRKRKKVKISKKEGFYYIQTIQCNKRKFFIVFTNQKEYENQIAVIQAFYCKKFKILSTKQLTYTQFVDKSLLNYIISF